MITSQKIVVVEKIEKDYDFNGNKGTSRAVRVLIGIDVFRLKVTPEVLNSVELEKTYTADVQIRSVKEMPVFELLSVKKTV